MLFSATPAASNHESYEPKRHEVLGLVNHTHPAATQLLQDAVVRDGLANHA
jgi:hypothetical protein